jgi:hypothetical protein
MRISYTHILPGLLPVGNFLINSSFFQSSFLVITRGICCRPGFDSGRACRCSPGGCTCCGRCPPRRAVPGGETAVAAAVGDGGADRPRRTRYRSQTRSCRLCSHTCNIGTVHIYALRKKKIKFSSYIRKFRVEKWQSHIRGKAS